VRSPLPTGVGARLQEERVRLGLTKRALADALGATEKTIYNYERDATSMSVATLEILGKLGADVEYVTFGERAKPRKGRAD
jgi:transcriptional regulator with XRE-family HTH domain